MTMETIITVALNVGAFIIAVVALLANMKKAGKDEIATLRLELEQCEQRCQDRLDENITLLRDLAKQARDN